MEFQELGREPQVGGESGHGADVDRPPAGWKGAPVPGSADVDLLMGELHLAGVAVRAQQEALVDARQRVEREWRLVEDIVRRASDAYVVTDADGTIRRANHAAAALLRADPDALVGLSLGFFVADGERRDFRRRLEELAARGRMDDCRVRMRTRDGIGFDAAVSAVSRPDEPRAGTFYWWLRDLDHAQAERVRLVEGEVLRVLADAATLDDALPGLLDVLCARLEWDVGVCWRVDRETSMLRCAGVVERGAAHGPAPLAAPDGERGRGDRSPLADGLGGALLPMGIGLAGQAWARGAPVWQRDVTRDPSGAHASLLARAGVRRGIAAPVRSGGAIWGVVELLARTAHDDDAAALRSLADATCRLGQLVERSHRDVEREVLITQLEGERSRLEAIVQQLPVAAVIAEAPSGRLVRYNRQFEVLWRRALPLGALLEQCDPALLGVRRDGRPYRAEEWPLARALRSGELVPGEDIDFCVGGEWRTMRVSAAPVRDRAGQVVAGVVTYVDAPTPAREEAPDGERARLLRDIVDQSALGIALVDAAGRFVQVNRALCTLLGYDAEELLSSTLHAVTHPADAEKLLVLHYQMLNGKLRTYQLENRHARRDGRTIWALVAGSVVRDAHGTPVWVSLQLQDISDRRRVEEARRLLAAVAGGLMESLDERELAHGVARTLAARLGGACVLDLRDDAGLLHRAAVAADDAGRVTRLRMLVGADGAPVLPTAARRALCAHDLVVSPTLTDGDQTEGAILLRQAGVGRCAAVRLGTTAGDLGVLWLTCDAGLLAEAEAEAAALLREVARLTTLALVRARRVRALATEAEVRPQRPA